MRNLCLKPNLRLPLYRDWLFTLLYYIEIMRIHYIRNIHVSKSITTNNILNKDMENLFSTQRKHADIFANNVTLRK